jgi:hypothetical protein
MLRRVFRLVRLLGTLAILGGTVASCLEGADVGLGDCPNPVIDHKNAAGELDPCCVDKSVPCHAEAECDGECMPTNANLNWGKVPNLFWYGDVDQAPSGCPDPTESYWEGHAEPISVGECPGCVCSDPACVPPASVIASDMLGCNGPKFTGFPVVPNGSCSNSTTIQPNELKSLAILSPTVSACTTSTAPVVVPKGFIPDIWRKRGIVCTGTGNGTCSARGDVCVPSTAPPSGFMQCIENTARGDELTPCPDEGKERGYKRKFVIYDEIDNKIACTPCQCGAPVGSVCTASVSAYQDKSCVTPIFENYVIFSGNPQCVPVGPNLPLQGVTSEWITNQPGKCTPDGGKVTGNVDVDHATARALCCWE